MVSKQSRAHLVTPYESLGSMQVLYKQVGGLKERLILLMGLWGLQYFNVAKL